VLLEQLGDDGFKNAFTSYVAGLIAQARADQDEFRKSSQYHLAFLARYWEDKCHATLACFTKRCGRDVIGTFRAFQDAGHIEIVTSSATHGYSPLLSKDTTLQAQVRIGVETYERHFGVRPKGFWLPECAYRPSYAWTRPVSQLGSLAPKPELRKGVEEFLAENGIDYFFADSHLDKGGIGIGVYADRFAALGKLWRESSQRSAASGQHLSPYYPYAVNSTDHDIKRVCVLARDPATGTQVWSGSQGYPGDEWYLEFHRRHQPSSHSYGLRYWRVSQNKDDLGSKDTYDPSHADERVMAHAAHFAGLVADVLTGQQPGSQPIVCSTYDTELFGHWWYEGPRFLYHAIKYLAANPHVRRATCSEYLLSLDSEPVKAALPEGSWGEGGFHYIWLNEETEWAWKLIYEAEQTMQDLAASHSGKSADIDRLLSQAAREMLLLCASDWPFCITTDSARDYATVRIRNHYDTFAAIARLIGRLSAGEPLTSGDWKNIAEYEVRDRLFKTIDTKMFAALEHPPIE
jgi:1,4-alpha-glucan branching enzyme